MRPESSEHEYQIPTISAQRMTPSAPAPGGVSNLQRIFITSEQERAEVEDLSQISFVTDALTDVFITDFNFSDSSKESGGKGSKIKSSRKKADETAADSDSAKCSTGQINENTSEVCQNTEERTQEHPDQNETPQVRDQMGVASADCGSSTDRQAKPGALPDSESNPAEPGETSDILEDEDYALSTESETDDYKVSQKAAQSQSENSTDRTNENRSDDDKGALIISKAPDRDLREEQRKTGGNAETGPVTEELECSLFCSESENDCDMLTTGDNSHLNKEHSQYQVDKPAPSIRDKGIDSAPGTSDASERAFLQHTQAQKLKFAEISNALQGTGVSDFFWDRER